MGEIFEFLKKDLRYNKYFLLMIILFTEREKHPITYPTKGLKKWLYMIL